MGCDAPSLALVGRNAGRRPRFMGVPHPPMSVACANLCRSSRVLQSLWPLYLPDALGGQEVSLEPL